MADTLTFFMGQDYFKGDALYSVSVDGIQYGGTHSAGRKIPLFIDGDWKPGLHKVEVSFVNDYWEGTPLKDRNLEIRSVEYDGKEIASNIEMYSNGTVSFYFEDTTPLSGHTDYAFA